MRVLFLFPTLLIPTLLIFNPIVVDASVKITRIRKTTDWVMIVSKESSDGDKIGVVPLYLMQGEPPEKLTYSVAPELRGSLEINNKGEMFLKKKSKLFPEQQVISGIVVGIREPIYRKIEFTIFLLTDDQIDTFFADYFRIQRERRLAEIESFFQQVSPTELHKRSKQVAIDVAHRTYRKETLKWQNTAKKTFQNPQEAAKHSRKYLIELQHTVPLAPHSRVKHRAERPD